MRILWWLVRRFRWVALGAAAKMVARTLAAGRIESAVNTAATDLERTLDENLPAPVARTIKAAPADLARIGGSAIVAGRSVRRAAGFSGRAASAGARGSRKVADLAAAAKSMRAEVGRASEDERRRLRSEQLRAQGLDQAADDALLDIRPTPEDHHDPFMGVPEPVARGRRRSRHQTRTVVDRVQRHYRRRQAPWETPRRPRGGRELD